VQHLPGDRAAKWTRLFDRDPEVAADHWAARNLRLWQVILVWLLAIDLRIEQQMKNGSRQSGSNR
jgi:fatty acid desaturase